MGSRIGRAGIAVIVAATVCVTAWLTEATPAGACTCIGDETVARQVERADSVFTGRPVRVTDVSEAASTKPRDVMRAAFDRGSSSRSTAFFKGDVARRQMVLTASSSAACGVVGIRGPMLVFASQDLPRHGVAEDVYLMNMCSGTTRIVALDDVPAGLGSGEPPPTRHR